MTFETANEEDALYEIIRDAKRIATRYREITGRPLGVTGEIGEYEAARLLHLRLAAVREAGFDAYTETTRYQIKTRCRLKKSPGARLGGIDLSKEFDAVLLVILDGEFEPLEIHEASREAVVLALTEPGSRSRNLKGQLGIRKFISIGTQVWPRDLARP